MYACIIYYYEGPLKKTKATAINTARKKIPLTWFALIEVKNWLVHSS